jgi:hypothetical protein
MGQNISFADGGQEVGQNISFADGGQEVQIPVVGLVKLIPR